jgi:hypothetical protein
MRLGTHAKNNKKLIFLEEINKIALIIYENQSQQSEKQKTHQEEKN